MKKNSLHRTVGVLTLAMLWFAVGVQAQVPIPLSSQFDLTGFLEEATLDAAGLTGDVMAGGILKVNGHRVIVPRNTIVEFPANAITWQQIFAQAPLPYGLVTVAGRAQTGMAKTDSPAPLTTHEVHVVGNRVGDTYIAGLIDISQQSLNAVAGYINYIDYTNGEMRVGGVLGDPATGTRVRINDPIGRFGKLQSPDIRFTIDEENPTIRSETGFPMGLAASDPTVLEDPLRPRRNRPVDGLGNFVSTFTMAPPGTGFPDPNLQVPFEIGDYISFAGTRVKDASPSPTNGPTAGPWPANGVAGTYISAHTIIANLAIYTAPGTQPAYVAIDVTLLGAGGITAPGLAEAAVRTKFEGFCTDASRIIHLYGVDVNCTNGATTDRDWGTIDVDPGPPTGAVKGRWRFAPPGKVLTMPTAGVFLPATREVRAVLAGAWVPGQTNTYANGLLAGQYHAPILEYIFPENVVGAVIPPNNFETFPFLAQGGLTVTDPATGNVLGLTGQLSPWPGTPTPPACNGAVVTGAPPVAVAGPNQAVPSGATVILNGSGSFDPNGLPLTYGWTQTLGPARVLTPGGTPLGVTQTFTAPTVPFDSTEVTLTFQLIVTNTIPLSSAPSTITITVAPAAALPPVANAGLDQSVPSAVRVNLDGRGSTDPQGLGLTYVWTQTAGPAVTLIGASSATPNFTAPAVAGTPRVLTFQLTVRNTAGLTASAVVNVSVSPSTSPLVPIAVPGPAQTVVSRAAVTLDGSGSFDPNVPPLSLTAYTWTQIAGPGVVLAGAGTANPTFTAPLVSFGAPPQVLTFRLIVRNSANLNSAPVTVDITVNPNALLAPVISAGAAQIVPGGTPVTLHGTAVDPNTPPLPLTITWTGPATLAGANSLTPSFIAPTLASGAGPVVLTFTQTVRNTAGAISTSTTTVTVNPPADTVTVTAVEYRLSKQRLTVNATSSTVSRNVTLTLRAQPGVGGWPDTALQNLGGGLYQLILVGVEQPPSVTVTSSLGGTGSMSPPNLLWKVRQ